MMPHSKTRRCLCQGLFLSKAESSLISELIAEPVASTDNRPPCFLAKDPMDFDLADALDDKNDGKDAGRPDIRPGEGTLTPSLHPACHQPRCLLGPAGDPPRPLPGTGSRCRTPSPPSEGVRKAEALPCPRVLPAAVAPARAGERDAPAGSAAPSSGSVGREGAPTLAVLGSEGLWLTTCCLSAGFFPRVSSDPLNCSDCVKFPLIPIPDSYLTKGMCCWGSQPLPRHKSRAGLSLGITYAIGWEIFFFHL